MHRIARDPNDIGLEIAQYVIEIFVVEPQVQQPYLVPVEPRAGPDVLQGDRLRDRTLVTPADDLLVSVRVYEQDAHGGPPAASMIRVGCAINPFVAVVLRSTLRCRSRTNAAKAVLEHEC